MLKIQEITVSFGEKVILSSITADFFNGNIYGIFGLNGEGKTTLFNTIYGIYQPKNGSIELNGNELKKQELGFLETDSFFYSYLTGEEYLNIFKPLEGIKPLFNIHQLASLLRIPLHDLIENYSTGTKKKLAILGIIKMNREVYLFDEPFNGLDVEASFIFKSIIQTLKENGKIILIASHIIESLSDICDSFVILSKGKISIEKDKNRFIDYCQTIYLDIDTAVRNTLYE